MGSNTEPEYITVGTIAAPWGLQGYVKVNVETDFPQRFSGSSQVYIDRQAMVIDTASWHKGKAIIKLHGVDTEEEANNLTGRVIEIHHSQLFSLENDVYFHFQLIDLNVITTGGEAIGKITEILSMASADIYVIKGKNGEILIPATEEIIKSIDLGIGIMVIEPMDGLLDLNEKKTKK
ncbi:MAG: 16S rRNA processing protein RimM [Chloroflexi bacterium RBG_13_46_14]|nr:MAG: 16S rRNA processing protein RimM [Chloroflexi bacterium RBG_13_46_14]